eukprot:scaffold290932_cov17-Tisochrysis_lutea.AAC.1
MALNTKYRWMQVPLGQQQQSRVWRRSLGLCFFWIKLPIHTHQFEVTPTRLQIFRNHNTAISFLWLAVPKPGGTGKASLQKRHSSAQRRHQVLLVQLERGLTEPPRPPGALRHLFYQSPWGFPMQDLGLKSIRMHRSPVSRL